jgi:pre-mRNA-splicing factor SYF2
MFECISGEWSVEEALDMITERRESIFSELQKIIHYQMNEGNTDKPKIDFKRKDTENKLKNIEAEEKSVDLERVRQLDYTLAETEVWDALQKESHLGFDSGKFSNYQNTAYHKFLKDTGRLKNSTQKEGLNRLLEDIAVQDNNAKKFSKRRKFDYDEEVTYINKRNYHFNKKLSRAFDEYTKDIRSNLERGTRS